MTTTGPTLNGLGLPPPEALGDLPTDVLLDALGKLADAIAAIEAERDELYAYRLAVYRAGRARSPQVTNRAMADRARVTEVAVIQAMRPKKRKKAAADAAG